MKALRVLGLLSVSMALWPVVSQAQTTTLEYIGSTVTGDVTYLPTGYASSTYPSLPSSPFSGVVDGYISLEGSAAAGDLTLESFNFVLQGNDGVDLNGLAPEGPLAGGGSYLSWGDGVGSELELTTSADGAITGATVSFNASPYHGPATDLTIGLLGDSVSYTYASIDGTCQNMISYNGAPYTGNTINPCTVNASNSVAGKWQVTEAPELDSAFAFGSLTLLLGGLAVLRSRRRRAPPG